MAMTIALFKKLHFAISRFGTSTFRYSCGKILLTLHVAVPETLKWSLSMTFRDFGFHDFGTPLMKSLYSRLLLLPVSETPVWSLYHFTNLGFATSGLLMMRVFVISISRYPKSRYPVLQAMHLFRVFPFRHFGTPDDVSL